MKSKQKFEVNGMNEPVSGRRQTSGEKTNENKEIYYYYTFALLNSYGLKFSSVASNIQRQDEYKLNYTFSHFLLGLLVISYN